VPENLKIDGSEETLTIKVVYDTKKLYGNVTAERKFVVY
jgi:hypothetical protein